MSNSKSPPPVVAPVAAPADKATPSGDGPAVSAATAQPAAPMTGPMSSEDQATKIQGTDVQPLPKGQTTDGKPPGSHLVTNPPAPVAQVPSPEGHVADPKASPKDQVEQAIHTSRLGLVRPGTTRIKLNRNVQLLNGLHAAGTVLDVKDEELGDLDGMYTKL